MNSRDSNVTLALRYWRADDMTACSRGDPLQRMEAAEINSGFTSFPFDLHRPNMHSFIR